MGSVVQPRQREAASRLGLAAAVTAWTQTHSGAGAWSPGTAKKYAETWRILGRHSAGGPVAGDLAALDTEAGAVLLLSAYRAAWSGYGAATRGAAPVHNALGAGLVARECGWLHTDWTRGEPIPSIVVDRTRQQSRTEIGALWRVDAPVREKTLWRMEYETTCRADELLGLDIPDLELANKRARVPQKGGTVKWIRW